MRHYAELVGVGSHEWQWQIYQQPLWRHILATLYCDVWEPRTQKIAYVLDRPAAWLHRRRCNDDCMKGVLRSDGQEIPLCGRIPLDARQDLRCYVLTTTERTEVTHFRATAEEAYAAGWPKYDTKTETP